MIIVTHNGWIGVVMLPKLDRLQLNITRPEEPLWVVARAVFSRSDNGFAGLSECGDVLIRVRVPGERSRQI